MIYLRSLPLLAALALTAAHAEVPANYRLVWSDEFDTSKVDDTKWNIATYRRNAAQNSRDAVTLKDGAVVLTTYTEGGKHFTGFLDTGNKFQTAYGYFEARIRFSSTSGEWGAFWLQSPDMGKFIGDPAKAGTEIDIVEHRASEPGGKDMSNVIAMAIHWDGYGKDHKHKGAGGGPKPGASPLQGNWHVYAVLWTPERLTYYLDGVEQWTTDQPISQRAHSIRLTCEVKEKGWIGDVPAGGFGSRAESKTKMEIDWIHVHQLPSPPPKS